MARITNSIRRIVSSNIRALQKKKYPERGGGQRCAADFGVSPQQWSPWSTGKRMPDESRMEELADFFGVTVAWLREDHGNQGVEENGNSAFALAFDLPETETTHEWAFEAARAISDVVIDFCQTNSKVDPWILAQMCLTNLQANCKNRFINRGDCDDES